MMDLSNQDDIPTCRICHCTESPSSGLVKLISPCHCSGSLKYVHHSCLQQWLDATNSYKCELCKHPFSMSVKYKPLYKWGSLNASPSERRRLFCNSVFNLVSMVCIFWSIFVLIDRAALDAADGRIDWSFYVKISVVTIGLIIGVIFLFVQLKLYFSIFRKWRQSNRIIVIRNANFSTNHGGANQPSRGANNGNSDRASDPINAISGQTTLNNQMTSINLESNCHTIQAENELSVSAVNSENQTRDHVIHISDIQMDSKATSGGDEEKNVADDKCDSDKERCVVPTVGIVDGKETTTVLTYDSPVEAQTTQDRSQDCATRDVVEKLA